MKKIVLVIVVGLMIYGCRSKNYKRNSNIIVVNDVEILIPLLDNQFIKLDGDLFKSFAKIEYPQRLYSCYLDTLDYKMYVNNRPDKVKSDRYLEILNDPEFDFNNNIQLSFSNLKPLIIKSFSIDTNNINVDSLKILNNLNDTINKSENNVSFLNKILFIKDNIISILTLNYNPSDMKSSKQIHVRNYIYVKKQLIVAEVNCNYYEIKDYNWAINFSETWAKSILEANK